MEHEKNGEGPAIVPALVCALVCVVLLRTGLLTIFLLVPLGFAAYGYNVKTAWAAVFGAALLNFFFALFFTLLGAKLLPDAFFFALILVIFGWIVAPPEMPLKIAGRWRLVIGSVAGILVLLLVINSAGGKEGFYAAFQLQAEALSAIYQNAAGANVVQRSLLEEYFSPESLIKYFQFIIIRGGGLVSFVMVFFVSRQISLLFTRIIRHRVNEPVFLRFRVEPFLIWVLSFSLLLILGARAVKIEAVEIILWNVLVLCVMLYLAQGWGILTYFLARPGVPPFLRLLVNVSLIVLFFRTGINAVVLGLITLLGIAENWVPFRVPKSNGSSSTPGM
ncbi:hypothetical protein AGMMS49928_17110 [Spirochaetia bacterium]|nr:hypothetical protein AGMMS49928_17110 [Spirochaetia bacterium]